MKAPRLASLAAFAAAFFYVGGLTAAAQTAAAPEPPAASPKSIIAEPAAKKTASTPKPASAKKPASKDSVHVYLLRGLLNVFSLGMDELADKIRAAGIQASVHNHTEWESIADQIAANYKAGNRAPVILIGHSLGADSVVYMADNLGKRGVPVALLVPFDGTQTLVASGNVARMMNITQRDYAYARRGSGFRGELQNIDVSTQGVDHLSIDKSERLHMMVLNKILAVVKKGETPAEFATFSGDKNKDQAKVAPKPAAETAAKPEHAPAAEKPVTENAAKSLFEPSAAQPAPVTAPAIAAAPVAPPVASAPRPVSTPTDRLEYEKLVLPKN